MIREAVVAGAFYPGDKDSLKQMLGDFINQEETKVKALGIVSPHAGYIYSGKTAGKVFSKIEIPDKVIILGPNHRGIGSDFALYAKDAWETPLGKVLINTELAEKLLASSKYLQEDETAHQMEHSLEVQVPFLQYLNPKVTIVPIIIGGMGYRLDSLLEIGESIGKVIAEEKDDVLIVASSDMTHYESKEAALKKDKWAIDEILNLEEEKLFKVVRDKHITMCGVLPTIVMLKAVKSLSPKDTFLVEYTNSGEVSGDFSEVVGYAGIVIS